MFKFEVDKKDDPKPYPAMFMGRDTDFLYLKPAKEGGHFIMGVGSNWMWQPSNFDFENGHGGIYRRVDRVTITRV